MAVDYDGVILGGTRQGREAAALGVREGARMALVEPPGAVEQQLRHQFTLETLAQGALATTPAARWAHFMAPQPVSVAWTDLGQRMRGLVQIAAAGLDLEALGVAGVDVLSTVGQFSPQPHLAVTTDQRRLSARGYLLCPPTQLTQPQIPGLANTSYLTVDTLLDLPDLPQTIGILGSSATAIALAQSLALLGSQVTLISRRDRLLPTEDLAMATVVAQLLRAAGVTLHLGAKLEAIHHGKGFKVTVAGVTYPFEHLLLATAQRPQVSDLNLQRVGISLHPFALAVDEHLGTTHPRVFACGPGLGGYWSHSTDQQDVAVALRNLLYVPRRRLGRFQRVGVLATVPAYGRVGLTATQAQAWYGDQAQVLQVSLDQVPQAHGMGDVTGFCRWVVHGDGRLLGAQVLGPQARELVQTLALVMHQGLTVDRLGLAPWLPDSFSSLVPALAAQWQRGRWRPGRWRRDWAENWFNWRRSRRS